MNQTKQERSWATKYMVSSIKSNLQYCLHHKQTYRAKTCILLDIRYIKMNLARNKKTSGRQNACSVTEKQLALLSTPQAKHRCVRYIDIHPFVPNYLATALGE